MDVLLLFALKAVCLALGGAALLLDRRWLAGMGMCVSVLVCVYWLALLASAGVVWEWQLWWLPFTAPAVLLMQLYFERMFDDMEREIRDMHAKYKYDAKTA